MKSIELSRVYDLRRTVRYRVSPLFELGWSLHLATRPDVGHPWADRLLEAIRQEGLEGEYQHFAALFKQEIPDLFSPQAPDLTYEPDGLYRFLADLPLASLVKSFSTCLKEADGHPLRQELDRNPNLVKGRFTLFLSAYMRLVFQPFWQDVLPAFQLEMERRNREWSRFEDVQTFAHSLLDESLPDLPTLVLHLSWFYPGEPYRLSGSKTLHIVYPLAASRDREPSVSPDA